MDPKAAAVYKKIKPRTYVDKFLSQGIRSDGRGLNEFRKATVTAGSIATAAGSAMVKLGRTTVVAGIHLQLERSEGGLEFTADAAPFATRFQRRDMNPLGEALLSHVRALILPCFDVSQLVIAEIPGYAWSVTVALYVLDDGGNVRDAALLATIAALRDTKVPNITEPDDEEEDRAVVAHVDESSTHELPLENFPIAITFATFGDAVVADPNAEESSVCDSTLTLLVRPTGELRAVQKPGGRPIKPETLVACTGTAAKRAPVLTKLLGL